MKALELLTTFLAGAVAGVAIGVLVAPEKGCETQKRVADTVDAFCKKHNIKLSRKEVDDFVDDLHEAASEE